jgi:transcriptional regulator with GAF, ATPase, and Fis domain
VANFLREETVASLLGSLNSVALDVVRELELLRKSTGERAYSLNLYRQVQLFEADLIRAALVQTGGNQTQAARLLGVKVTTLNSKIKRCKISCPPNPTSSAMENLKETTNEDSDRNRTLATRAFQCFPE